MIEGRFPDVAERAPSVPPPLADVCRRAMARARDDRFADARAMAGALRAWLDSFWSGALEAYARSFEDEISQANSERSGR